MQKRKTTSLLMRLFHRFRVAVGAGMLTIVFFLVLPLIQAITPITPTITAALAHLASRETFLVLADADVDAANLELLLSPTRREQHTFMAWQIAVIDEGLCTGCGTCERGVRHRGPQRRRQPRVHVAGGDSDRQRVDKARHDRVRHRRCDRR